MATVAASDVPLPRTRAPHTRTATLGLLLAGTGPLFMLILGTIAGMDLSEEGPFLGIVAAVAFLAAGLSWAFGTWSKVVGILASIAVGMTLFWTAFGLAYPKVFGDFVAGVLVPLGVALGLGGSIAAIVKRKQQVTEATPAERRIRQVALAIVAVAVAVSGALSLTSRTSVDSAAAADAVRVDYKNFEVAESTYTVASGGSLLVHNGDAFAHEFEIAGVEGSNAGVILPGSEILVPVDLTPGTYTMLCRPHSSATGTEDGDMAATLVVE